MLGSARFDGAPTHELAPVFAKLTAPPLAFRVRIGKRPALMRNRLFLSSLIALSSLAAACGDDDDEGRPRYRSGVQGSSTIDVADLDDDDLDRICESLDVYIDTNIDFSAIAYIACLPPAIVFSGGNAANCERRLDECTKEFPEPIAIQARVRNREVCYSNLQSCRASVADLEGCVNLNLDLALDILDWSCSGSADEDLRERAARAMDTASICADIDSACRRFAAFGPD